MQRTARYHYSDYRTGTPDLSRRKDAILSFTSDAPNQLPLGILSTFLLLHSPSVTSLYTSLALIPLSYCASSPSCATLPFSNFSYPLSSPPTPHVASSVLHSSSWLRTSKSTTYALIYVPPRSLSVRSAVARTDHRDSFALNKPSVTYSPSVASPGVINPDDEPIHHFYNDFARTVFFFLSVFFLL